MSIKTKGLDGQPVTACHGFQQPYDLLVRLKGGDILSPPSVEQRAEATAANFATVQQQTHRECGV